MGRTGEKKKKINPALVSALLILILISLIITITPYLGIGGAVPTWNRVFAAVGLAPKLDSSSSVHFLDVGQADCTLITSDGKTMLIDSGSNADEGRGVVEYIRSLGIDTIDVAIVTHAHEDHAGGMDFVIEKLHVKKLVMSKSRPSSEKDTFAYEQVLKACEKKKLSPSEPSVGEQFQIGQFQAEILHTDADAINENNRSVVIKAVCGQNSFLFMGDAESEVEQALLSEKTDLKADVLKAGHHGSKTSTTAPFLNAVTPKYVVFSVGEDNSFGHPSSEVLDLVESGNQKYYRTDVNGTVAFRMKKDGMDIKSER